MKRRRDVTSSDLAFPLSTDRLVLRRHTVEDATALLSYYRDVETVRYSSHTPWDEETARDIAALRGARAGIAEPGDALALVVLREGRVVGDVGLWTPGDSTMRGEMGWTFHPDHRGRGYATEAVTALIRVAFELYGMHRVHAEVDPRNVDSIRLCERLDMRCEGHLRQDYYSKGEWCDTLVYALLRTEWMA